MDGTLTVIGLNHKSSPIAVRERFWLSSTRRLEALRKLAAAPGILEAVILVTCNRSEFILWTSDYGVARRSIFDYLTREFGLSAEEWASFYRLQGDEAVSHIFRVTASLDSLVVGEPHIVGQVKSAWQEAQQAGTTGRYLDTVFKKALTVSRRVRNSTAISESAVSVPYAAVELARRTLGSLEGRKVLILGAGKMGELSARYLVANGASTVLVVNRTYEHAAEVAQKLDGVAVPYEERWRHLADADIVISSTGCPHVIVTREDGERIVHDRRGRPLLIIDIAVPRDVDPEVRKVAGITLYNIDDLEQAVEQNRDGRRAAAEEAEALVAEEVRDFRRVLAIQRLVPTLAALSDRLEEIRQEEMERYRQDFGPLAPEAERALEELTSRTVQRISKLLSREVRETTEVPDQDMLTAALRRLFRLPSSAAAFQG